MTKIRDTFPHHEFKRQILEKKKQELLDEVGLNNVSPIDTEYMPPEKVLEYICSLHEIRLLNKGYARLKKTIEVFSACALLQLIPGFIGSPGLSLLLTGFPLAVGFHNYDNIKELLLRRPAGKDFFYDFDENKFMNRPPFNNKGVDVLPIKSIDEFNTRYDFVFVNGFEIIEYNFYDKNDLIRHDVPDNLKHCYDVSEILKKDYAGLAYMKGWLKSDELEAKILTHDEVLCRDLSDYRPGDALALFGLYCPDSQPAIEILDIDFAIISKLSLDDCSVSLGYKEEK